MSWGAPLWLWLLILPAGIAGWLLLRAARADAGGWPAIMRVTVAGTRLHPARAARRHGPWLLLAALALSVVALARPRWGEPQGVAFEQTREVMIALDLSRSMMVEDVGGSRLKRSHQLVNSLLEKLQGERVGLVIFAGSAFVQVPLSSDYAIIHEFLPLLGPDYMPQGGSDYTGMLKAALDGFGEDKDTDRFLIVLSDGESTTEGWREQLVAAAKRNISVISLAVGTEAGGLVPTTHIDPRLQPPAVFSKLQPATLQALAAATGGIYHAVSKDTDVAALLAQTVEQGRQGRFARQIGEQRPERFQWVLALAAIFGAWGLWREIGVEPRGRTITRASRRAGADLAGALAVGVLGGLFFATEARAHDDGSDEGVSFRALVNSTASGRLLKTVEHLARKGYDVADVRQMVEETVHYGIEAQTQNMPLQAGVVHDAIEATYEGERLDPREANWPYLRAQLQRLIVPPAPTAEEAKKKAEDKEQGWDEEDRPPESAGQSTQQSTSESGGEGGPSKTDAQLGELKNEPPRAGVKRERPPVKIKPFSEQAASDAPPPKMNGVKALALRSWRAITKADSPGFLHQSLQGGPKAAADGKDY